MLNKKHFSLLSNFIDTQKIITKARTMQGNCRESGGKCKNTLLKPRIVQGNCMETGGKLKNTFFAKKSA